jgi:ABC-type polysaccharide/polyol phosphate export permease
METKSVYTIDQNHNGPIAELVQFSNHGSLTKTFIKRNLKTLYNRSLLGWLWSVVNPLTVLIIYTLVFGRILNGDASVPPGPDGLKSFTLYLFSALVTWNFYSELSVGVMTSFAGTLNLRSRVYFPTSCAIFASFVSVLLVLGVEMLVLVGAYIRVVGFSMTFLLVVPILGLVGIFGLGVGLILASPNIRFRDVGHFYNVFLRLLFFMTPIIYPISLLSGKHIYGVEIKSILLLNPLTHFVEAIRQVTYFQETPTIGLWIVLLTLSSCSIALGWMVFVKYSPKVIEST